MTRQLRTGFTVNGDHCPDKNRLLNWVANARPTTMPIMDSMDLAVEVYNVALGETKACHRLYDPAEGAEWKLKTPQQYVNEITSQGHPEIYRQVLNEPAINTTDLPFLLYWLMGVMDELYNRGYKGVIGNFPMGQITQVHIEDGLFDDFLRHCNQYRDWHYIGIHEYTAITRYFGVGQWSYWEPIPTDYFLNMLLQDMPYWPTRENLPCTRINGALPPYWHVRRADWLTIRSREIGISDDPEYWVTESGYDNMQDVSEVFPVLVNKWGIAPGYDNLRGFNSLANVWAAYWPHWTFDEAAFEQEVWLDEECYPANYIGWNNFMWTDDQWRRDGFDMSQNLQFQALLVDRAVMLRTEPDPPDPDPEPIPDPPPPELPYPLWKGVLLGVVMFLVFFFIVFFGIIALSNWKATHVVSLASGGYAMETLQIMPVNEAGQVLLAAIMAIIAGGMASPVTVPVVNLVKFILAKVGQENLIGGNMLAAIVAAVVTVVIWVSRWAGVELQVNNVLDLLQTVIPPVVTFLGMFVGQKSLFSWAVRKEVPVVGYQRTK
jgi:hypothetical protein